MNGYIVFIKTNRHNIMNEHFPNQTPKECFTKVAKKGGELWNNLSEKEKNVYNNKAKLYKPKKSKKNRRKSRNKENMDPKSKKSKKSKGKKRKMNEYFKTMLAAKKANKPSFVYKGKTYKGVEHDKLGMIYKKE